MVARLSAPHDLPCLAAQGRTFRDYSIEFMDAWEVQECVGPACDLECSTPTPSPDGAAGHALGVEQLVPPAMRDGKCSELSCWQAVFEGLCLYTGIQRRVSDICSGISNFALQILCQPPSQLFPSDLTSGQRRELAHLKGSTMTY